MRDRNTHLVDVVQRGTEATVHTKHASVYDGGECKIVEHFAAIPPDIRAPILPLALVIETVDLGNLSGLVVAPDECYSIRIAHFER